MMKTPMVWPPLFLFTSVFTLTACWPDAPTAEHPCELAKNCVYDAAAGESNCVEGHTWQDPTDANNYNCVLIAEGTCTATTCAAENANCGTLPDGCEGTLDCGTCPAGQTCGAAGANQCGEGQCIPTTCAAQNAECGNISDGCGGILDCGTCPAGETCAASNICVDEGCIPTTCAAENAECGSISDGCGGNLDCGTCSQGEICGAEAPNRCDICEPYDYSDACALLNRDCGPYVFTDNCGQERTLQCGICPSDQTCNDDAECVCEDNTLLCASVECGEVENSCYEIVNCGTCAVGICGASNTCIHTQDGYGDMSGYQANAPWPMYGYSPTRVNRSPLNGPSAAPSLVWSYEFPSNSYLNSPVIAADGTIYVVADGAKMHALSANGTLEWTFVKPHSDPYLRQVPVIAADGTLYISAHDYSEGGYLYAVSSEGTLQWQAEVAGYAQSPLLLSDGSVIVHGMDLRRISATGDLLWSNDSNSVPRGRPAIAPNGSVLLAGSFNLIAYEVGGSDLSFLWSLYGTHPDIGSVNGLMVFPDNVALTADYKLTGNQSHHLRAISADGNPLWVAQDDMDFDDQAMLSDGRFLLTFDELEVPKNGKIECYNPDGSIIWRYSPDEEVQGLVVDGSDRIYTLLGGVNYGGHMRLVSLNASGSVLWQHDLDFTTCAPTTTDTQWDCSSANLVIGDAGKLVVTDKNMIYVLQ